MFRKMLKSPDLLEKAKRCDFFAGDAQQFEQSIAGGQSFLCQGAHRSPTPAVTILITTYKRPEWLELALRSALTQRDYDDYEVVVVDNEGLPLQEESGTSRLVARYACEKLLYYRNTKTHLHRENVALACVKTRWICFLHDDDFLSCDHLHLMMGTVLANPHISWLSCWMQPFQTENEAAQVDQAANARVRSQHIRHYTPQSACATFWPGWQGAIIDSEKFINIGGISRQHQLVLEAGDTISMYRYSWKYGGLHFLRTTAPLYFYRYSDAQLSSLGMDLWTSNYAVCYLLLKYMARIYHPHTTFFWNYIAQIYIYELVQCKHEQGRWLHGEQFDMRLFRDKLGIPLRRFGSLRLELEYILLDTLRYCYFHSVGETILHFCQKLGKLLGQRRTLNEHTH